MSYPVLSTLGLKRSSQNWRLANCFIAKRGFSIQVPLELFGTILEHIMVKFHTRETSYRDS